MLDTEDLWSSQIIIFYDEGYYVDFWNRSSASHSLISTDGEVISFPKERNIKTSLEEKSYTQIICGDEVKQRSVLYFTEMFSEERRGNIMILETKRLILRPWRDDDAEELYRYASDPEVGPPAGWLPHTSVENSREVIRTVLSAPDTFAVCLKEDGKAVGSIGFHHNDLAEADDEYELGYWIGRPFWGQGLIPEAGAEMLRYAFEKLGMERIWCGHYEGNVKSRRVMEKLGFVHHHTTEGIEVKLLGEIRTGHAMLLTKERWKELIYCGYLESNIDIGLCYDILMISNGYIKPSALSDVKICKEDALKKCNACPHKQL